MNFMENIEALQNVGGGDSSQVAEMMSQMGITDPLVQKLITMLEAQNNSADDEYSEELPGSPMPKERSISRLSRENELLRRSNDYLVEQSQMLASAIGACPECWGEDPSCRECEGEGQPGAFLPHRGCFEVFVMPVVDTLRSEARERREHRQIAKGQDETRPQPQDTGAVAIFDDSTQSIPEEK